MRDDFYHSCSKLVHLLLDVNGDDLCIGWRSLVFQIIELQVRYIKFKKGYGL